MELCPKKPRLLFLCTEFRYPTQAGSHVRISNLIKIYSEVFDVHLLVPRFTSSEPAALDEFYALYVRKVHVVDQQSHDSPETSFIRYLVGPRTVLDFNHIPYIQKITEIIAETGKFDVIHVERWFMTDIVKSDLTSRRWASSYILDFDASDYSLRKQLARQHTGSLLGKLKVHGEPWRVRLWEFRHIAGYDAVYVSSRKEFEELHKRTRCRNLMLIPNGYDACKVGREVAREREVFLFVGTLSYGPNLHAFEYFAGEVFPLICQASPKAEFWHVGSHPDEMVFRYGNKEGVRLLGFVDDLATVYQEAAVVVAPLFYGSGTRIKILEAASFGKAIVATEFASEDLGFTDSVNIRFAETASSMAETCLQLLKAPDARSKLGEAARSLVKEQYSWGKIGTDLRSGLRLLLPKSSKHNKGLCDSEG